MNEVLERIQTKIVEQQLLLKQLAMWDAIKKQGINADDIQGFGFDPMLMDFRDRRNARLHHRWPNTNPFDWPLIRNDEGQQVIEVQKYNFVTLKNGNRVRLNPMVDAPK